MEGHGVHALVIDSKYADMYVIDITFETCAMLPLLFHYDNGLFCNWFATESVPKGRDRTFRLRFHREKNTYKIDQDSDIRIL